ncbi:MAG: bifunctional UDP-sugar hydrolase/5'-nucleotidase [Sphaerochaetaceae bacterium]
MKRTVFRFSALVAMLLIVCLGFLSAQAAFEAKGPQTITIIGTTDLHGNVWGFSYEDNKETANNGMARVYSYVKEVRETNANVILVDNGDTIQGNILTDDLYNKRPGKHPVIEAMNFMRYDAMSLGNHEFNFGEALVSRIQGLADFPILAANMSRIDGTLGAVPYAIVVRNGVRVGIIGLTNPNVPRWDGEKADPFTFAAVGPACRKVVDVIKDKVDVIVVLAHVGLVPEYDEDGGSDGAQKILELCPEVDVILVGHAHIVTKEKIGGTVVGGGRNLGRDVVRFDLSLDENRRIVDSKVEVIDMAKYTPSEELRSIPFVVEAHQATRDFITGGAPSADGTPSGGIFGVASVDFQPTNEIKGIPEGKLRDTAVMDLINSVQLMNSGADVSAAALFSDTSNIKAGNINYGTIFGIYKYDNTLYRVEVTGAELKKYMEWSASCYNQWVPGDMSISFNPEKPGYLYDMFAGVDYGIDLSKPAGQRIVNVMYKGKPLQDDTRLKLAVNNYRYSSALKSQKLVAGKREWESAKSIRDMLVEYIKSQGTLIPQVDDNWRIVGVDLSSVYRDEVVGKVNRGELEVPYAKALNVTALKAAGVIK